MKKLVILIIVIVALGVLAPFFIGNQAETEFRKLYADINLGPEISFEVRDYNKGWFSSTATVAAVINLDAIDPSATERFTTYLKHHIQHGPLLTQTSDMGMGILDVNMTIEAPEEISAEYPELNNILNEVVTFASRVGMDGSVLTKMIINGYEHSEDNTNLNFKKGLINFTVSDNKRLVADGNWQGLSMSQTGQQPIAMTMGPVSMTADMIAPGDQPFAINGIMIGSSTAKISEIKFDESASGQSAMIKNIAIISESDIADDSLSGTLDMTIDSIDVMGLSFTNFVYDLDINSLDVPALQKVNELANQISSPQINEQDMQALQDALMMLLQGKPEVVINNIGITTAQGDIKNTAKITVAPALIDKNDPMSLLAALELQATGNIPEAFLQSMGIMPMLQPYISEGILEIESGEVRYDMVFEGGQMQLFGKPYQWTNLVN